MTDNGVIPINEGEQPLFAPHERTTVAFFGLLQRKANTRDIALALKRVNATPTALEADLLGFAETHVVHRLIRTCRQCLSGIDVDVLFEPGHPDVSCIGMKGIF